MSRVFYSSVVLVLFIYGISANTVTDLLTNNDTLTNLITNIPGVTIPTELQSLENAAVKIEEAKKALREKCLKESGDAEAYDRAYAAMEDYNACVTPLLDFSKLKAEMEEAQPKGDLDTVFNRYCGRRHQLINCTRTVGSKIEPCLSAKETVNKNIAVNMFVKGLDFVCHKEGDQIALFIAEKGPECFKDKNVELQKCVKDSVTPYLPNKTDSIDFKKIPTLDFDKTKCQEMENLSHCLVKVLEGCEESTPANLVESMFRFIKNESPCKTLLARSTRNIAAKHQDYPRSSATIENASITLLLLAITAFFVK